jgi:hypothetical protein
MVKILPPENPLNYCRNSLKILITGATCLEEKLFKNYIIKMYDKFSVDWCLGIM